MFIWAQINTYMRLHEIKSQQEKIKQIKKFAEWAISELEIESPPNIKYGNDLGQVTSKRTFGSTSSNGEIWVHVGNRNTADIMRTLAHELTHHRQFEDGTATDGMDDEQRLRIEDEANAIAGRLMRAYGKQHAEIYEGATPDTYVDYVLFANGHEVYRFNTEKQARDFIRQHMLSSKIYVLKKQVCQYQPINENAANDQLKRQLLKHKKTDYDSIDGMMTKVAERNKITPKKLHDVWVDEYGVTPDTWIKRELKKQKEK